MIEMWRGLPMPKEYWEEEGVERPFTTALRSEGKGAEFVQLRDVEDMGEPDPGTATFSAPAEGICLPRFNKTHSSRKTSPLPS
ncbi:hypothetical protein SAMN02927900_00391 [Rhizobium mongolense subsp. loessense]|uniref:Uncharacterized protein n=1 Tax=Rhizobium mongolense subsp. loessense TaxID=158890 RepID=A0A1G4PDC6_9HYPH|nr:hypothetical protein SAMN02927900_00391 [Rhizobium mongolense subsp. loessense]